MKAKEMQLFIFPYAGGNASSFRNMVMHLDHAIIPYTIEYSGHGKRIKEPLANSFQEMLEDSEAYILKNRDASIPYAIMGYSMGALLTYEFLKKKNEKDLPTHTFIAAEVAPHIRALELRQEKEITESSILKRAKELGGLNECMLNDERFKQIFLKPMISDFAHFFAYRFCEEYNKKIHMNTTYFYNESDTQLIDVKKWNELFDGKSDFYRFGSNHFFINEYPEEIANIINDTINNYLS